MFRIGKKITRNGDNITTLLSEGTSFEGSINSSSSIRVEGLLKGDIKVEQNIIVGETGKIIGNINSSKLIVFGTVEGLIKTHVLKVHKTANIKSESVVEAEVTSVEDGAVLECKFSVGKNKVESGPEVTMINFKKQK